jgi:hypothetical protein
MDSDNSDSLLILVGMLLSIDYDKAVMEDYKIKKKNGDLSLILTNPTPSTLRDECLAVCKKRCEKSDYRALSLFFGPAADKEAFLKVIDGWGTDKFRPPATYLKKGTKKPESKNVEILAWLIDFQPRPVDKYKSSSELLIVPTKDLQGSTILKVGDKNRPGKGGESGDDSTPEVDKQVNGAFNFSLAKAVGLIILITSIIVGIRFCTAPANMPVFTAVTGPQACMFWDGDHYQRISCSQNLGDTLVIGLDSVKLNHFRLISCPGTTNEEWKGKLWYAKFKGKVEFYTGDGYHPIDHGLRLKPVTDYILRKYCQ